MAYDKHSWETKEPITKAKMQHIEDGIEAAASQADTNVTAITNLTDTLRTTSDSIWAAFGYSRDSLKNKTIQNYINELTIPDGLVTDVANLKTEIINAREQGYNNLQATLQHIRENVDGVSTVANGAATKASAVETEIKNARTTYATLKERLAAIVSTNDDEHSEFDTAITQINNIISAPIEGKDETLQDWLAQIVGANRDSNDTLKTRFNEIETELSRITGTGDDTIKAKLTALINEIAAARESTTNSNATYANLDERLEADERNIKGVKDEVADAHRPGVENDNLNARFTSVESALSTAQTELGGRIDTVANTAAVASEVNTALNDIDARLDALDGGSIADTDDGGSLTGRVAELEVALDYTPTSDEDTTPAGLTQRINAAESDIDTLEGNIGTINTALGTKANATDVETALAGKVSTEAMNTAITNAVKDISTTIIKNKNEVAYTDNVPSNTQTWTISDKDDYLLQAADDKYYYWKHIDNAWHLMGGAGNGEGGTGNTTGIDLTREEYDELTSHAINTDYYVLESDNTRRHYRYIEVENESTHEKELVEIEIGITNPKKYNIALESIDNEGTTVNYLNVYEFDYDESNTIDSGTDLDTIVSKRINRILLPATGGSGGSSTTGMKILQITSRNTYKAANSNDITKLRFFFTSGEAYEPASYTVAIDGTNITSTPVNITSGDPANRSYSWPKDEDNNDLSEIAAAALGFYAIDITQYCKVVGPHTVTLTIALDANASITASTTWNVTTFNLAINSSFTENPTMTAGQPVSFTYVPTGNIDKVAHFVLDGNEIGTQSLAARVNTTQTYVIPAQAVGAHKLEAYLTANNDTIRSASVYRDIIWYNADDATIILASPYRGNQENISQYSTLRIPYTVVGGTGTYTVKYFVDDFNNSVNEVTLTNTNGGAWNYRAEVAGEHTLRIQCETKYIDIQVSVEALENVDIAPVTTNLALDFNPAGISNTSTKRLWTNGTYSLTVSDNFDWYNGGYGSDVNGDYFLVKAGTRAIFDYPMFTKYIKSGDGGTTSDSSVVYRDGAEFKIIFKTDAVRSADAVWFTNVGPVNSSSAAKEVGIQLNVHNGWLKTDAAGDSTKSYLYFPYSEEDKIELDININKETEPNAVYCMSYEDGCPSRAYPYASTEALYQDDTKFITIGSDDCDVYIYRMRIYNSSLTTEEVLRNFIADGKDVTESVDRYNRNCIYYDTQLDAYTPYENGNDTVLDPVRLAQKIPDVKILMLDTPHFTTSKKDFIKDSTLRCIHAKGGTIFPSRGKEDNWFFGNGYHSGQGTTSDKYGNAGRNVDFLFNCDGVHKPSDKVSAIEGYQSYVIRGYGTDEQEEPEYCTDWKGDSCKVALTATSIPNNFFNLKVNIASSENTNNALLQKRYNDYLTDLYQSLAYARDNRIKNDMEFVPAILFVRENDTSNATTTTMGDYTVTNYPTHTEFNDTEWHFYALGNIGDSKKTDYTRAYDPTDINEFTLEISDNNTNNSQFQTGVYLKNEERTIEPYVIVQDMDDGKIVEGSFTANSTETDIGLQTRDYIFPIDKKTEWEALDENGQPKNMRYWSLMNEGFDGDHTFEMRYACRGNYRDGKLVNDTDGLSNVSDGKGGYLTKDKYQLKLNTKVWQAFYTWLITSDTSKFIAEADQWFVRSSMAYFYAFTHYYTMTDNRAKNTFWHFAKTGKHRIATSPVKELLHIYEVADGEVTESSTEPGVFEGQFKPTTDTEITAGTTYYTQYAFDMWAYDMDTALGIDNNGELVFPYGKEDDDYRTDSPSSGDAFNGAGSIFWRRLKTELSSDVTAAFTTVNNACFNADNLIIEFDKFQSCYPEAIWRLDVERKYIRSFTGDEGIKDSNPYQKIYLTRKETRFLSDMMQGRKKYQRRQWIKNQAVYFGSKYFLPIISTNQNDMVCENPGTQNVMPNWDLTITPYQDMYIRVDYAETSRGPFRAKAGKPIEITCPFNTAQETRVRIYGADYIQALAGKAIKDEDGNIIGANSLASLYFRGNSFSNTHKLRELIIGTDDPTYNNALFTSLNLSPDSPILETLDIQNCSGLSGSQDLSGATALKTVKAQGTSLTQIVLPNSTNIENLYLPATTSTVMLVAAKRLKNVSFTDKNGTTDMSNLTTLIVNDSDYSSTINWLNIANSILPHVSNLQLLQLNYASIVNINALEPFVVKKNELGTMTNSAGETISRVNLSGTVHVTGNWSAAEKSNYETIWPKLELDTTSGTETIKHKVTYLYDGKSKDIYVTHNDVAPEIYVKGGEMPMPTQASTPEYSYIFGSRDERSGDYIPYSGWYIVSDNNPSHTPLTSAPVVQDTLVLAAWFQGVKRQYSVRWLLDPEKVVKTSSKVDYGDGKDLQVPTVQDIHNAGYETCSYSINNGQVTYSVFNGWEKTPVNIQPDGSSDYYDIYPTWETNGDTPISLVDLFNDTTNLTPIQLYILSEMNETQRTNFTADKVAAGMRTTYQLGYDINTDNQHVIISDKNDAMYLNGSNGYSTNYQPLLAGADAFTLAIDYSFDDVEYNTINSFATLVSCYYSQNGVRNGFTLCKNLSSGVIEVGFGDMYRNNNQRIAISNVANSNMRNVVVLRHAAGSPTLQIYSGINGEQTLPTTVYSNSITRTGEVNFNSGAYLNIGQLIDRTRETIQNEDTSLTTVANAKGNIYWMKLWDEDLGEGACRSLANWPHEYLTLALAQLNSSATNHIYHASRADYVPTPTLQLASLNTLQHGLVVQSRVNLNTNNTEYGWHTSLLRTVLKDRLFYALPFTLQAIVSKANTLYLPAVYQEATFTENGQVAQGPSAFIRDYIVGYSAANVTPSTVNTYESESDMHPFSWRVSNSVQVFTYANNTWSEATGTDGTQYLNLRFPTKAIPFGSTNKLRVYVFPAASTIPSNFNVASTIGRNTLRSGDVYVENSTAYIYVSNKERNLYGLPVDTTLTRLTGLPDSQVDNIDSNSGGNGGWVKAEQYWTRSAIFGGVQYTAFATVNIEGGIDNNTSTSSNGYKFNYLLAI